MKGGVRGVGQTPGERWPFAGVGLAMSSCLEPAAAKPRATACCSAIYGRGLTRTQVDCMPGVHPAYLERAIGRLRVAGQAPLELRLADLPHTAAGALDASAVLRYVATVDAEA
eukprot:31754-Prymnesium_polylepis.1